MLVTSGVATGVAIGMATGVAIGEATVGAQSGRQYTMKRSVTMAIDIMFASQLAMPLTPSRSSRWIPFMLKAKLKNVIINGRANTHDTPLSMLTCAYKPEQANTTIDNHLVIECLLN